MPNVDLKSYQELGNEVWLHRNTEDFDLSSTVMVLSGLAYHSGLDSAVTVFGSYLTKIYNHPDQVEASYKLNCLWNGAVRRNADWLESNKAGLIGQLGRSFPLLCSLYSIYNDQDSGKAVQTYVSLLHRFCLSLASHAAAGTLPPLPDVMEELNPVLVPAADRVSLTLLRLDLPLVGEQETGPELICRTDYKDRLLSDSGRITRATYDLLTNYPSV